MIKNIIIYILCGICALFAFNSFLKDRAINTLTEQNTTLQNDLKAQITITPKRQIIYKTRTLAGEVKTVIKYLPPEGSATINQNSDTGDISLKVTNKGLSLRLAAIGIIDKQPALGFGARLLYWGRYGVGAGLAFPENRILPLAFADRYVDDFIPFAHNTSIGITAVYDSNNISARAGVITYF